MASKICAISLGSKSPAFTAGNPGPTTAALPPPSVLPSLHDPSPLKQPSTRPILVAKVAQFLMAADWLPNDRRTANPTSAELCKSDSPGECPTGIIRDAHCIIILAPKREPPIQRSL